MNRSFPNGIKPKISRWGLASVIVLALALAFAFSSDDDDRQDADGVYVAGDFHQHTTYTDGSNSLKTVMYKNNQFGLDWWANSEHGGSFATDARGPLTVDGPFNVNGGYSWTNTTKYPANPVIDGTNRMWRWQSIRDFSFFDVLQARGTFFKPILQSFEWNVPGHEHCSLGNIANQFDPTKTNADPLAQFEYLYDSSDTDVAGGLSQGWTGKNTVNNHAKAVQAVQWLHDYYPTTSYAVFAHVERKQPGNGGYTVSDFRDFNNAAPGVAFGFESMPGHQKEAGRGGYSTNAVGGGTYGGTGIYSAQVGGLWDSLLGEGRHWWLFASSDFHNTNGDFWPGEYQKTYTYVTNPYDPQAIVNGLRSGNSYVVEGDLIKDLDFHVNSSAAFPAGSLKAGRASMGQELIVTQKRNSKYNLYVTIRFRSPEKNNNGDRVTVDHIDLIGGNITGMTQPGTAAYNDDTNPTTHIIATFKRGDWKSDHNGWNIIRYQMKVTDDIYLRLRGTNIAPNTAGQTDPEGNPLPDSLVGPNTPAHAYADLWFYSNPIFVYAQ